MPADETTFLYELARNSEELKLVEYALEADKPIIRYRAAELLGGLATGTNPDARERTRRALRRVAKRDENDSVRAAAIDALYLRDEASLEALIDDVAAGSVDETPTWMRVDRVIDWLETAFPEFRLVAAAALGRIGDETAVPDLIDVVTDPDVRVRTRAVESCGAIGDPRCIEALSGRLRDDHDRVRRVAAGALAAIGTDEALAALAPAARSDTEAVRLVAIGELGAAGPVESLPLLTEGLDDPSEVVRRTATRSLLELLANAPSTESHAIRTAVLEAVVDADPRDIDAQLVTILRGNQPRHVRRNATWLLGQLPGGERTSSEAVQTVLFEALDDADEVTAKVAMSALVDLEGSDLADRLRRFLDDEELSAAGRARAEFVRRKVRRGPSREAVTNSVEFTYVADPADYTAKKRGRDGSADSDETE